MIDFFVPGLPKPAGSKRAFPTKSGKIAIVDASGKPGKDWRADVKTFAMQAVKATPLTCALGMHLIFILPRPKGHFGTGKNAGRIKDGAPDFPAGRPDTTKLTRAVEDALTGIVWKDDAQIVNQLVQKRYGDNIGVHVLIYTMEEG